MTDFVQKANALASAWKMWTGAAAPSLEAILWPLAQADIETQDGDAWGGAQGPMNWGAIDLRAPNVNEIVAIRSGALTAGMWLYADGTWGSERKPEAVGQLHLDTHPGGTTYPMWFRAFASDVEGAESFLEVVLRMVGTLFSEPNPTLEEYATRLYRHGYYEGRHAGARPYPQRALPLTTPEAANVADYVRAMQSVLTGLTNALDGWTLEAAVPVPIRPLRPLPDADELRGGGDEPPPEAA